MSFLSGPEIERIIKVSETWDPHSGELPPQYAEGKYIRITPFEPKHVGANSVDLRIARKLFRYGLPQIDNTGNVRNYLDSRDPNRIYECVDMEEWGAVLYPNTLYLGSTVEETECHGLVPTLETRSSFARLGLSCHLSAGFGDDGFKGNWVLEITVANPIRIYPNQRICQVAFSPVIGERRPYRGKYSNSTGPTDSRAHEDQ